LGCNQYYVNKGIFNRTIITKQMLVMDVMFLKINGNFS